MTDPLSTPATPGNEEPRKHRMTIWSLILGIVGLACVELIAVITVISPISESDITGPEVKLSLIVIGLCAGILAIVAAHVVIPRLRKEAPIFKEHGFAIVGLITGYLTIVFQILILATLFLTSFTLLRSQAKDKACYWNLKEMYLACRLFAEDHDGQLPQTIADLKDYVVPENDPKASPFLCPLASDRPKSSYEIVLTGKLGEVANPKQTILIRETGIRHGLGRFAVYADGHVGAIQE